MADRTRRAGLKPFLRVSVLVVAAAGGVVAILTQRTEIAAALAQLHWFSLLLSGLALLAAAACVLLAWRTLLADLGSPLPYRAAARVLFLAQLGKYLPGSVWALLAQVELGRAHRVPARRSAAAGIIALVLSLATGLLCAAVLLPLFSPATARRYGWAFLLAPVLLAAMHPRLLNPLLARTFRLLKREPPESPSLAGIGRCVAWSIGAWVCYGLHVWFLIRDLGATEWRALPLAVGGFALAWSVGFLVVFAPSGAGFREAALTLVLAPVLSAGPALLVSLTSRVMTTVVDLLLAGGAAAAGRRRPPEPDPQPAATDVAQR